MKLRDRKFRSIEEDDGTIILIEQLAYLPKYASRHKWTEDRVVVTRRELRDLAVKYCELDLYRYACPHCGWGDDETH